MSAFDQAASIAAQYGGNFGQELARQAAQAILNPGHVDGPPAAQSDFNEQPAPEKPAKKQSSKAKDAEDNPL